LESALAVADVPGRAARGRAGSDSLARCDATSRLAQRRRRKEVQ